MRHIVVLLAALAALFGFQGRALASHYRSASIHWSLPANDAPETVLFTATYGILAASPPPLRAITLDFGDGTSSGPITGAVVGTATDAVGTALEVREVTVTHTYAGPGTYTAFLQDCCRIGSLVNGANEPYRVATVVTLQAGNTAGPVTGSLPIVELQLGAPRSFVWPALDPDGDPITCRFGTDAEAGFAGSVPVVPSPGPGLGGQAPAIASHPDGCELGWDLSDAKAGQKYTIHLVFEANHDGVISSTELDVIVEIVTAPPPACSGGGTFTAGVGQALSVPVTGTHAQATPLSASIVGAPSATLSPGGSGPSPFDNTFAWTPEPIDAGSAHVVLVRYEDTMHLAGTCFLAVLVPGCPGAWAPCSAGVGECAKAGEMVCTAGGGASCDAVAGEPSPEICGDGLDQDCDGSADDGCGGSGGGGEGGSTGGGGTSTSTGGGGASTSTGGGGATSSGAGTEGGASSGDGPPSGCGTLCAMGPRAGDGGAGWAAALAWCGLLALRRRPRRRVT